MARDEKKRIKQQAHLMNILIEILSTVKEPMLLKLVFKQELMSFSGFDKVRK